MTSKQRSYLKGLANGQPAILHIGKTGVTPEIVTAVDEALEARELVKIDMLKNCGEPVMEAAETVKERTRSELIQVVGRKIILYRKPSSSSTKKQKIELPKK